jgi:predicted O-linked N-acetylglucosamine transferase (SPINDLY family)
MAWLETAYQELLQGNYAQVAKIYEQALEDEPEEIPYYWYLGVAYLLQEKEEEAQTTWFCPFMDAGEETTQAWTEELLQVLETEAQRQETNQNYRLSWLLRQHIREIKPHLIENLLCLLRLELTLETFNNTHLTEWGIVELIKESPQGTINSELLENLLTQILKFPTLESVALAESALLQTGGDGHIINIILSKANYMGNEHKFLLYAADLTKLCLKYQPDNLAILKELFWYYALAEKYEELKEVGTHFYDKSQTIGQKAFGSYQLLYLTMLTADWLEVIPLAKNHQILLQQMATEQPEIPEQFIRDSFIIISQPLLYIDDKPRENRSIINQISALFQKNSTANYICPVHFPPPSTKQTPKKLKIGYIGHTLRGHSVGWLSRWLIHYHNREEFSIALYFINQKEDEITQKWFREKADLAVNLPKDVKTIFTQIVKDEIDILVDLDSFTFNITGFVMALKPAPVQVSWLGMDSTGIPALDYFIADPYVLPEDAQQYYQETIWRLPHTYIAVDGFEVDVPTLKKEDLGIPRDAVVYFNVQNALKRHPDTIHLQMKILRAVPNGYLLIKGTGKPEIIKKLFTEIAEEEQVDCARLIFLDRDADEAIHRANLSIADIVLDTYPYNGATTTLETLWMGIPLVTRVGEQFAARNSYAFMMNVGVSEGLAYTDDEYVEWGIKLGTEENLRQQVAWKLRQSRKTSPLWNAQQFTREMEKAYQQMWQKYLDS